MKQLTVRTKSQFEMIDITNQVRTVLRESTVKNGVCYVFVPHTTAAVTINENADPNVPWDMIMELDKVIPLHDNYRHMEGNSAAHIKSTLVSPSLTLIIDQRQPILGTWQTVYFCEFDGPRHREVYIKIISD